MSTAADINKIISPEFFSAEFAAQAVNGSILAGNGEATFPAVSADSRTVGQNELFVALKGENFDAHDFAAAALERGAGGMIANETRASELARLVRERGRTLITVKDTLIALGDLARAWRLVHLIRVLAITGSTGKSTTKEMTAAILSRRFTVLKNAGNLNNLIGLPLTLLRLRPEHRLAITEMGMNRRGEIARLTQIAVPDAAIITNVGPAHLELLGSLEAVAEAKGELFAHLRREAKIAVNLDDPRVKALAAGLPHDRITFGLTDQSAEVKGGELKPVGSQGMDFVLTIKGKAFPVRLPVLGEHNVKNAVAAAAAALLLGLEAEDIVNGLAEFSNLSMRLEKLSSAAGVNILNDTYNANPASVKAALATLADLAVNGRRAAALGDMLELGAQAEGLHREVGQAAARLKMDYLFLLGKFAAAMAKGAEEAGMSAARIFILPDTESAARQAQNLLGEGDWLLVKGSRGMRLENMVRLLMTTSGKL